MTWPDMIIVVLMVAFFLIAIFSNSTLGDDDGPYGWG